MATDEKKKKNTTNKDNYPVTMTIILSADDLFRLGVTELNQTQPFTKEAQLVPIGKPSKTNAGVVLEYGMTGA